MDPLSAFKNEVFRPVASIVLPGMLAIGPIAVAMANAIPEIKQLFDHQTLIFFLLFTGASTVSGMLLENVGSSIERGIDRCMETEYLPGAEAVWGAYLALSCSDTYAKKYLGSLVTRLKFINAMIPAVFIFGLGIYVLHLQVGRWNASTLLGTWLFLFVLISWLFRTSTELSEAALFSRLKMLPPDHGIKLDIAANTVSRFRHFAYVLTELRSSRVGEFDFKDLNWWQLSLRVAAITVVAVPIKEITKPQRLDDGKTATTPLTIEPIKAIKNHLVSPEIV